ncbi:5-carboxymethyl-2-hydroxymuconate Delta-isomerase [Marilutibacter chinensis]|uniref:5-carboxymethyl-2-hydroxymuconate Delta-isomerase n=1 Tax=Marilutibacter chinensis TaxID=2912247 RepID=A0ABS9HWN6_9GAMM|nr:5-carboxymethyl-2-hydroxymuconate Delta-isomerase [Lysobacter chinensis]MCF7222941.1 5-carboxymethyl-2-hydroxymuconate Delta-isomerase [Lysobacter chinensis]
MPHFVIDCSQGMLRQHREEEILARLHHAASSTGLFDEPDIKVRVNPFRTCAVGGREEDFIHVFSYIMQGRTVEQRADLSKRMVSELVDMFPTVHRIAMNVAEFEKATYLNREML